MNSLLNYLYAIVPQVCVRMIEKKGIRSPQHYWSLDIAAINQSLTRELMTHIIINQMLKCLERKDWSENTVKIIILAQLYSRCAILLENNPTEDSSFSLYGLLHGILLILSGKVVGASKLPTSVGNELIVMIFTHDDHYKKVNDKLISNLERFVETAKEPTDQTLISFDWIAPTLLILDVYIQPILIDKAKVQEQLSAIERPEVNKSLSSDEVIISSNLAAGIREKYFTNRPLYSPEKEARQKGLNAIREEFVSILPPTMSDEESKNHLKMFNDFTAGTQIYSFPLFLSLYICRSLTSTSEHTLIFSFCLSC